MQRRIAIKWLKEYQGDPFGGVYRLWVGDKYYIGRSYQLLRRRKDHAKQINIRLNLSIGDLHPKDYYQHIIRHLFKNPRIKVLYIEVIKTELRLNKLIKTEQRWLDDSKGNPSCLNFQFSATPRANK